MHFYIKVKLHQKMRYSVQTGRISIISLFLFERWIEVGKKLKFILILRIL